MKNIGIGTYAFGFGNGMTLIDKLRAAKDMGYTGVEFLAMDLQQNSVEDLKAMLEETGLQAWSAHVSMDLISELMPKLAAIGGKMCICPGHPFADREEALDFAKLLTEKGKEGKALGLRVGYHNHTSEFFEDDGERLLDIVIENSDPDFAFFQLDCGWATAAGIDCAAYIDQYPGRFISVHVKENNAVTGADKPRSAKEPPQKNPMQLDENGKPIMTEEVKKMFAAMRDRMKIQCPMGDPTSRVDWKAIKAVTDRQDNGCLWIVEREYDYKGDILACLKDDCDWLTQNL